MAKLIRFSGFYVNEDETENLEEFKKKMNSLKKQNDIMQQLHVEESENFKLDGEDEANCDLALLTRHFKKDINEKYTFDRPLPVTGQKYRHFKLGKVVTIVGISRNTETEELTVVYDYEGYLWNRPLDMFMSEIDKQKYPDAKQKYRFELI